MVCRLFSNRPIYFRFAEKCTINIAMVCCSPIQGTRSKKDEKLWYKAVPYFWQISGPRPLDWRTILHWNVDPVFFQQSWFTQLCWKIVGTTFECTDVLQSRRQDNFFFLWSQDLRVEHMCWGLTFLFRGTGYNKIIATLLHLPRPQNFKNNIVFKLFWI